MAGLYGRGALHRRQSPLVLDLLRPHAGIHRTCGSFLYTSLFGVINIQILNCYGIFGHLSVIFRPREATISWAFMYLNIFRTKSDVYKKHA